MENQIPLDIEQHLQDIGVLSSRLSEQEELHGEAMVDLRYSGPLGTFNEDGEPQW